MSMCDTGNIAQLVGCFSTKKALVPHPTTHNSGAVVSEVDKGERESLTKTKPKQSNKWKTKNEEWEQNIKENKGRLFK